MSSSSENNENRNIHDLLADKTLFCIKEKNTTIPYFYVHEKIKENQTEITSKDFNNFIMAAVYRKKNSFISKDTTDNYKSYSKMKMGRAKNKKGKKKIIQFMFTNFVPTEKHLDLLFKCYDDKSRYNDYYWIDILAQKKFDFTEKHKKMLLKIKYPNMENILDENSISHTIMHLIDKTNKYHYGDEKKEIQNNIQKMINAIKPDNITYELLKDIMKYEIKDWEGYEISKLIITIIDNVAIQEDIYEILMSNNIKKGDIIFAIMTKLKPTEAYIQYLIANNIINSWFNILFLLTSKYDFKITIDFLNTIFIDDYIYGIITDNFDEWNLKISQEQFEQLILLSEKDKKSIDLYNEYETSESNDLEDDSSEIWKKGYKKPKMFGDLYAQYNKYYDISKKDYIDIDKVFAISSYHIFEFYNIKPTMDTLELAYEHSPSNYIDDLIEKYKLKPTKKCLDIFIKHNDDIEMVSKILCYKITPDLDTFESLLHLINDYRIPESSILLNIIELLIKNGLTLTEVEIEKLIMKGYCLNDLERFGLNYDEKLYFICYKTEGYIPEEISTKFKIDTKILELRELCSSKCALVKFKQYIKTHNVKPDRYCIDLAIKFDNPHLVEYMMDELKCSPSIYSYFWACDSSKLRNWNLFESLTKSCNINYEYMMQPYDHIDPQNLP